MIAELAEDRVVDGLFAVARKQRLRTRGGNPYLALELVDSSGRIDARVWNDVDLLDKRFRDGLKQLAKDFAMLLPKGRRVGPSAENLILPRHHSSSLAD